MTTIAYRLHGAIAVAIVDHPPVNALSLETRRGLLEAIERFIAEPTSRALIIIGSGKTFVAGADIRDFGKPYGTPSLYDIMDTVMASDKPVIAAIHGAALGGGLELALACQWRIATRDALIGQPEVKLGLIPGGGGTQWWTRLAGPQTALEICTGGEPIDAVHAHARGVVDRLAEGDLLSCALDFAGDIAGGRIAARRLTEASDKIAGVDPQLFTQFRDLHREQWRGQIAPWKIVDCIEAACRLPFEEGYALERAAFRECEHSAQSRALIHLFFAERAASKLPESILPLSNLPMRQGHIGTTDAALARALSDAGLNMSDAIEACSIIVEAAPVSHANGLGSRLLELRCAPQADPQLVNDVLRVTKNLRKIAVVTAQGRSSLGHRLLSALRREVYRAVAENISPAQLGQALFAFGFPAETLAAIGASAAGRSAPALPPSSTADGRAALRRLLRALVEEGVRCLDEKLAFRPGDIDVACVHGLGFPAHRGGPMHWAREESDYSPEEQGEIHA